MKTLKKYRFKIAAVAVVAVVILVVVLCLCFLGKTHLDEEFTLSFGGTVSISGEDLQMTFEDVLQDNRCPTGAECVTEGAVICRLQVERGGGIYYIELAQPGLYHDYSQENFGGYRFTFLVEPYPEVDKEIDEEDYRLLITLEKVAQEGPAPTDFTNLP